MTERDSLRDSLQAELSVTRRLLAAMAAAAGILAHDAGLDPDGVQDLLGRLRKDSRLDQSAADAAIAWVSVEVATKGRSLP